MEERPSPIQVVVIASASTADSCHDLKSGFMEKHMQDLILTPPYLGDGNSKNMDPAIKTTHPDLISSDDHDMYVAMKKWSSLVTTHAVYGFLQASADLQAAAASPNAQKTVKLEKNADGVTVALSNAPPRNHNRAVTSISSLCFLVLSCMAITLPFSFICTFCRL